MKILFHIHGYPPVHNAGAEWMAHDIAIKLHSMGNEVHVIANEVAGEQFEGIRTYKSNSLVRQQQHIWADVVITHLDKTGEAINCANHYRNPIFHIVHNSHSYGLLRNKKNQNIIYNSHWMVDEHNYPQRAIICRPQIDYKRYSKVDNSTAEAITLINLTANKGALEFYKIAINLQKQKFIGVTGGYGQQIAKFPENVQIIDNTPNISEIYAKTKILIVPSMYESWGRVAAEAMAAGIPVIATATPGLKENIDYGGLLIDPNDREDISTWIDAINTVLNNYNHYRAKAITRSIEQSQWDDIYKLNQFLKKTYCLKKKININKLKYNELSTPHPKVAIN